MVLHVEHVLLEGEGLVLNYWLLFKYGGINNTVEHADITQALAAQDRLLLEGHIT